MKRLFTTLLIVFSLMISSVTYAQQTVKHVVQKGETIATIAANYGVTAKDIIALNPKAERYVFVGMELQIPQAAASAASAASAPQTTVTTPAKTVPQTTSSTVAATGNTYTSTSANKTYESASYSNQNSTSTPTTVAHATVGYDLSLEEKPENTSAWGVSVLLSVDNYLTDTFYCGLGAGLAVGGATTKVESYKMTATSYSLMIPLYIGFSPIESLDLDTGPSFNWLVGGGVTQYEGSKKISEYKYSDDKDLKRFAPSWRVSLRLLDFLHVGLNVGLKKDAGTTMTFGLSF